MDNRKIKHNGPLMEEDSNTIIAIINTRNSVSVLFQPKLVYSQYYSSGSLNFFCLSSSLQFTL